MEKAGINGYINSLYENVLLRNATENETSYWAGQAAQGVSSLTMAEQFVVSEEAQQVTTVLRLYDAFFDRAADIGGLHYWLNQTQLGTSLSDMARSFAASSEFRDAYDALSNAEYIEALYGNLFARSTDAAGKSYWVEQLDSGQLDRSDVAVALSFSEEALSHDGAATRFAEGYLALRSSGVHEPSTEVVQALAKTSLTDSITQLQTVTGTVQNGILKNAQVSRDSNGDGLPDSGHAIATTDENGHFTLVGGYGNLVVQGGYDLTTGRFNDKILATPGSKLIASEADLNQAVVITPLTTLLSAMVQKGLGLEQAVQTLNTSFGLDETINPLVFDHIGVAVSGTATAVELQQAVSVKGIIAQLSVIMENVAGVISGAAGQQAGLDVARITTIVSDTLADAIIKASANPSAPSSNVLTSLSSASFISNIIKASTSEVTKEGPNISEDSLARLNNLALEAGTVIANLNAVIQHSMNAYVDGANSSVTAIDALSAIAKAESIGQGPMQEALTSGAALGSLSSALSSYSGTSLAEAIKTVEIGLISHGVGSTSGSGILDAALDDGAGGGAGSDGGGSAPSQPGDSGGGQENSGSTQQAPWTLVMAYKDHGWESDYLLASDGSALGTAKVLEGEWGYFGTGTSLVANGDKTHAIIMSAAGHSSGSTGTTYYNIDVHVTDGTVNGSVTLPEVRGSSQDLPFVFGNEFLIIGEGGLFSDGTISGTQSFDDWGTARDVLGVDSDRKVVWHTNYSVPYGLELYRTFVTENDAQQELVKDINPGADSGIYEYSDLSAAILPSGNLVFMPNGPYGSELWMSDGTAAGTKRVVDADSSYISARGNLTSFGDKIVVVAGGYSGNGGVAILEETADGIALTRPTIDLDPGQYISSTQILGVVGDELYFTAGVDDLEAEGKTSMFSTDGTDVIRLADIESDASLLGWSESIAFFSLFDTDHGLELWAADLKEDTFGLVKDILPGSGSALAGYEQSILMVGDKLAFTAYTSASKQAYFLSDGTNEGTVSIGHEVPLDSVVVENYLFFVDSQGLHGVDASADTTAVVDLVSAGVVGWPYHVLQSDSDQAFYRADNGGLYVSGGTPGSTFELISGTAAFKVVAENAIFATKQVGDVASLWFSDGTVEGTWYVTDLEGNADSYDLANAVAIHTPGMQLSAAMGQSSLDWDGTF